MDKTVSDIYAHVDRHIYILYINTYIHMCVRLWFSLFPRYYIPKFSPLKYIYVYIYYPILLIHILSCTSSDTSSKLSN